MHIKLINKKLHFEEYRVKCSIGKRGISTKKVEGDEKTPRGTYRFLSVFYRKDRTPKIKTSLKKIVIKKNMVWCDDPKSKKYNKLTLLPFEFSAEKLFLKKNIYDIIIVLNYNIKPTKKNKGSAIFLHIAEKKYKPTKGCVAIAKKDILLLLKNINFRSKISIY
jgi:L,D-peptidoglycan transpeptidase YkuD (ErfK/YbiS/YcfS/YnhG family)